MARKGNGQRTADEEGRKTDTGRAHKYFRVLFDILKKPPALVQTDWQCGEVNVPVKSSEQQQTVVMTIYS